MSKLDTNQASEDELRAEILTEFKQVHKLAPADYTENCTNVVMSIIRTEKLKLLAEVRERVIGEKTSTAIVTTASFSLQMVLSTVPNFDNELCYYDEKLRKKQRTALNKLEAEL